MQFGVNLLPKKERQEKTASFKTTQPVAVVILVIYVIFIAGLFSFSFYISTQEKRIKKEESQLGVKVQALAKRESLAVTLKTRVEAASQILKNRLSHKELLARIEKFALPGVALTEVQIKSGQTIFSGTVQNVQILGDFFDAFQKTESSWLLVEMTSLSRRIDGIYDFSFEATPL